MRYQVTFNGKYMNTFNSYTEASEFKNNLQQKYPNAFIYIEPSE